MSYTLLTRLTPGCTRACSGIHRGSPLLDLTYALWDHPSHYNSNLVDCDFSVEIPDSACELVLLHSTHRDSCGGTSEEPE